MKIVPECNDTGSKAVLSLAAEMALFGVIGPELTRSFGETVNGMVALKVFDLNSELARE